MDTEAPERRLRPPTAAELPARRSPPPSSDPESQGLSPGGPAREGEMGSSFFCLRVP